MINIKMTNIICTLGPASNNYETLKGLVNEGMNIVRLNFSHGSLEEHKKNIELIRKVEKDLNANISILQDLPGPKIRIGKIDKDYYNLYKGDKVKLVKDDIIGNNSTFTCSYKEVIDSLNINDILFINDGIIQFKVIEKAENYLIIEVINEGGIIRSHKGMNIPSQNLDIEVVTDDDIGFIKFGIENDVDFIAVSYVRKKDDIVKVKDIINQAGANIKVIAKIENLTAYNNIDSILEVTDGIMVARGDLGIENPIEEVGLKQKDLIDKARKASKPSIVATQMLRSMVENTTPTRAEVTDITNAIFDGTDAVMLSEETAIGKHPVKVVKTMSKICTTVEKELDIRHPFKKFKDNCEMYPELALSFAAQDLAEHLDIKAFIVFTRTGKTAQLMSSRKINLPILAFTTSKKVLKHLNLTWGTIPLYLDELNSSRDMVDTSLKYIYEKKILPPNQLVLMTCGTKNGFDISTNLIELQVTL